MKTCPPVPHHGNLFVLLFLITFLSPHTTVKPPCAFKTSHHFPTSFTERTTFHTDHCGSVNPQRTRLTLFQLLPHRNPPENTATPAAFLQFYLFSHSSFVRQRRQRLAFLLMRTGCFLSFEYRVAYSATVHLIVICQPPGQLGSL